MGSYSAPWKYCANSCTLQTLCKLPRCHLAARNRGSTCLRLVVSEFASFLFLMSNRLNDFQPISVNAATTAGCFAGALKSTPFGIAALNTICCNLDIPCQGRSPLIPTKLLNSPTRQIFYNLHQVHLELCEYFHNKRIAWHCSSANNKNMKLRFLGYN